jgi:hypothetical protein
MNEVVLHIGSFKSGTTFIQACLRANRGRLARQGTLSPEWSHQAPALRALIARPKQPAAHAAADAWDRLVHECLAWDGSRALISMEYLSILGGAKTDVAVASFGDVPVRVVLTARHLAGALPAQWQTSLRGGGHTWTLNQYIGAASAARPRRRAAGRHFWRRHNWPAIVNRWGARVGVDQVRLVAVPAPGAPDHELWNRFCEAASIDPAGLRTTARRKESLGAASAELVRLVNVRLAARPAPAGAVRQQRRWVKSTLAAGVLLPRKGLEPPIVVPSRIDGWAQERAAGMLERVADMGIQVVGDPADLMVVTARTQPRGRPVTEQDVLDAAEYAMDRLGGRAGAVRRRRGRRLDDAVETIATMAQAAVAAPV